MSDMTRPYFWIRRNRDKFVPLIPVDELPTSIKLRDISITKNWEDVCQGEMKFLGDHYDHNSNYYVVDVLDPKNDPNVKVHGIHYEGQSTAPVKKVFMAPDIKINASSNAKMSGAIDGGNRQDVDQVQANIDKITSSQDTSVDGSQQDSQDESPTAFGNPGTLGKKVYCTYWIRTGNCNYMQEGCKYKHEIPTDDETRLAIGVRTYPTWPREDPTPPKPLKAYQGPKAALQQSSWRRQDTKNPQAELSGAVKPIHRPGSSRTATPVPASVQAQSGSKSLGSSHPHASASTSGHPKQKINAPMPSQHLGMPTMPQQFSQLRTNHMTQQGGHTQPGTPSFASGSGHYNIASVNTTGSYNGHSAHVPPQSPYNQSTNMSMNAREPLPLSQPPISRSAFPAPMASANPPAMAPPQGNRNPFTQNAAVSTPAQANGDGHFASSSHSYGSSGYPILQKPDANNTGQSHGFAFGATSIPNPSSPFMGATRSNNPPPYMPTHAPMSRFAYNGVSSPAVASDNASAQFNGNAFANFSGMSSNLPANNHANVPSKNSRNAHGNGPAFLNRNVHASSGSRVNTPTSSDSNAQATLSNNAPANYDGNTDSSLRAITPAKVDQGLSAKFNGDAPAFVSANAPATVNSGAQAPTTSDGSAFGNLNDNASSNSNVNTATDTISSPINPFEDVQLTHFSPQPFHRRMFREPGEAEYVKNPIEETHGKTQRTTKKHVSSNGNGKGKTHGSKGSHTTKGRGTVQAFDLLG